jgi:hypothetical protein
VTPWLVHQLPFSASADVSVQFTHVYRNREIAIQFAPPSNIKLLLRFARRRSLSSLPRPHQLQLIECEYHLLPVLARTVLYE